jgi:hypothetical protein
MPRLRSLRGSLVVAATLVLVGTLASACATKYPENKCEIRVLQLEKFDERPGVFDISYIVAGDAGTEAMVSLAARKPSGEYIAGLGVKVGPGPFKAAVDQKLTARPAGLVVLLEVKQARCRTDAKLP